MFYCGPSSRDIARSMRTGARNGISGWQPEVKDPANANCVACLVILGTVSLGSGIPVFLTNGFTLGGRSLGVALLVLGCLLWVSSCLIVCGTHCRRHWTSPSRKTQSRPKVRRLHRKRLPVHRLPVQQGLPVHQRLPVQHGNNFIAYPQDQRQNSLLIQEPVLTPAPAASDPPQSPGSNVSNAMGHNRIPLGVTMRMMHGSFCRDPVRFRDNGTSTDASSAARTLSSVGAYTAIANSTQPNVPLITMTSSERDKTLSPTQSNLDSGLFTAGPLTDNSPSSTPPDSGTSTPPPAYDELDWYRLPQPSACNPECKASSPPSYKDFIKGDKSKD